MHLRNNGTVVEGFDRAVNLSAGHIIRSKIWRSDTTGRGFCPTLYIFCASFVAGQLDRLGMDSAKHVVAPVPRWHWAAIQGDI